MSPAGITLLLIASFAGFAWLAYRKLSIVKALQPEVRWDQPRARAWTVVRNGFLQSRMIRGEWRPGIMHAAIFAGFLALLARHPGLTTHRQVGEGYHGLLAHRGQAERGVRRHDDRAAGPDVGDPAADRGLSGARQDHQHLLAGELVRDGIGVRRQLDPPHADLGGS